MAVTRLTTNGLTGTKYDIASADNYYMEPIATTLLSSGQATVTFSNIPQGYKHLQIRGIAKTVSNDQGIFLQLNGDAATNYSSHLLYGNGTSAVAQSNVSTWDGMYSAPAFSSQFTGFVIDILDYANTGKFKAIRSFSGVDNNGSGYSVFASAHWRNTAPITSITFKEVLANSNFTQHSRFSLYGIKG
jgi:hypothetical protein